MREADNCLLSLETRECQHSSRGGRMGGGFEKKGLGGVSLRVGAADDPRLQGVTVPHSDQGVSYRTPVQGFQHPAAPKNN